MSGRKLGIAKRVNLAELADGWDSSCFALVTPLAFSELRQLRELKQDNIDEDAALQLMETFVRAHLVKVVGKVFDDAGELETAELTTDEVMQSSDIVIQLFEAMTEAGAQYRDPKATSTTKASSPTEEPMSEPGQPETTTAASSLTKATTASPTK